MSTHDYNLANASGAAFRSDLNDALAAIVSQNSGTSWSTTFAYQVVVDTSLGVRKRRNAANSDWIVVDTIDETLVLSRTSNTVLDVSDKGKTVRATGTYTQTFSAVASLGDGWFVGVRVESGAVLTLDPDSTETIDGAATLAITGPASGFVVCNGSALYTVGLVLPATQTQQEAATSGAVVVTPANQHHHQSAVKGWVKANTNGTAAASYNVASITDTATGQMRVNWTVAFSSANYCANLSTVNPVANTSRDSRIYAQDTSYVDCVFEVSSSGAAEDPTNWLVSAEGDQ